MEEAWSSVAVTRMWDSFQMGLTTGAPPFMVFVVELRALRPVEAQRKFEFHLTRVVTRRIRVVSPD